MDQVNSESLANKENNRETNFLEFDEPSVVISSTWEKFDISLILRRKHYFYDGDFFSVHLYFLLWYWVAQYYSFFI